MAARVNASQSVQQSTSAPTSIPATNNALLKAAKVYQSQCYISRSQPLVTPAYSSCYILTAHDPITKCSLLAHIDCETDISSLRRCLKALQISRKVITKESADENVLNRFQWSLKGGWNSGKSAQVGKDILLMLQNQGLPGSQIDCSKCHVKKDPEDKLSSDTKAESCINSTSFNGGLLDPKTGRYRVLGRQWKALERENVQAVMDQAFKYPFKKAPLQLHILQL